MTGGPGALRVLGTAPDPEDAVKALAGALRVAGVVLPSLAVEFDPDGTAGVPQVDLGRTRADVVMWLAGVVRDGTGDAPGHLPESPPKPVPVIATDRTGKRQVFGFLEFTIGPDKEPDAEAFTYAMQCAVCNRRSPGTEDCARAQDWALRHTGRNRDHYSYREIITRPYLVRPADRARL